MAKRIKDEVWVDDRGNRVVLAIKGDYVLMTVDAIHAFLRSSDYREVTG